MDAKKKHYMAARLKELRTKHKNADGTPCPLSHAALSEALRDSGYEISRDSLINYERFPEDKTAAQRGTCERMSAETLAALADFYHVTTDYLLFRTGSKSDDPQTRDFVDLVGLSDEAVEKLSKMLQGSGPGDMSAIRRLAALNELILADEFEPMLANIVAYIDGWTLKNRTLAPTFEESSERHRDLNLYRAEKHFRHIIEALGERASGNIEAEKGGDHNAK